MRSLALVIATALALVASAPAQEDVDDDAPLNLKDYSCREHMEIVAAEDGRAELVTIWAYGYVSALRGVDENSAPITTPMVVKFEERLEKLCTDKPDKLFIVAVKELK